MNCYLNVLLKISNGRDMYTQFKTFCGTYSGTDADKANLTTNEYADIQRKSTFGGQNGIEHSAPP